MAIFNYSKLNKYIDSLVNHRLEDKFIIDEKSLHDHLQDLLEYPGGPSYIVEKDVVYLSFGNFEVNLNLVIRDSNRTPSIEVFARDTSYQMMREPEDQIRAKRTDAIDFSDPNWSKTLFNALVDDLRESYIFGDYFHKLLDNISEFYNDGGNYFNFCFGEKELEEFNLLKQTYGTTYHPKTKEELKELCDDLSVNLRDIDTSKVTDMEGIFENSKRTNEEFSGIESWYVSNCSNFAKMFKGSQCQADLRSWHIKPNADIYEMFYDSKMPASNIPFSIQEQYAQEKRQELYAPQNRVSCEKLFTSNSKYFDSLKINDNLFNHLGQFFKDISVDNESISLHQVADSYMKDSNLNLSADEVSDTIQAYKVALTASKLFELNDYSDYSFPKTRLQEFFDACDNCQSAHDCFDYAESSLHRLDKLFSPENREELKALCDNPHVNLGDIDTSKITDMSELFWGSERTNEQFSGIENWDTSNVTNMKLMFTRAKNFNQPIGDWDVSNVTNMDCMFHKARSFNQPLNSWDVSNVEDMSFMFREARSFNQPLDGWDVSNVEDMSFMFSLTSSFNQPLDGWDVSNVKIMDDMFSYSEFQQDLSSWQFNEDVSLDNFVEGIDHKALNLPDEILEKCGIAANINVQDREDIETQPIIEAEVLENKDLPQKPKLAL